MVSNTWSQYFDESWADDFEQKWIAAVASRSPGRSRELADLLRNVRAVCRGRVKFFRAEKGWGGIESTQTPFDVWVHFASIEGSGHRQLIDGQAVEFRWQPALQDSWLCIATWVRALPGAA